MPCPWSADKASERDQLKGSTVLGQESPRFSDTEADTSKLLQIIFYATATSCLCTIQIGIPQGRPGNIFLIDETIVQHPLCAWSVHTLKACIAIDKLVPAKCKSLCSDRGRILRGQAFGTVSSN